MDCHCSDVVTLCSVTLLWNFTDGSCLLQRMVRLFSHLTYHQDMSAAVCCQWFSLVHTSRAVRSEICFIFFDLWKLHIKWDNLVTTNTVNELYDGCLRTWMSNHRRRKHLKSGQAKLPYSPFPLPSLPFLCFRFLPPLTLFPSSLSLLSLDVGPYMQLVCLGAL